MLLGTAHSASLNQGAWTHEATCGRALMIGAVLTITACSTDEDTRCRQAASVVERCAPNNDPGSCYAFHLLVRMNNRNAAISPQSTIAGTTRSASVWTALKRGKGLDSFGNCLLKNLEYVSRNVRDMDLASAELNRAIAANNQIGAVLKRGYCEEVGRRGFDVRALEQACRRRLSAAICSDPDECDLFPAHRHMPNVDAHRDIHCEHDLAEPTALFHFGKTGCDLVDGASARQIAHFTLNSR